MLLLAVTAGFAATPTAAGEFEAAVHVGRALPFYSQSFAFDPGDLLPPDLFVASGGLSYMPPVSIDVRVSAALGLVGVPELPPGILPDLGVSASASLDGAFGGNLGAGVRVPVASNVTLVFEARAFAFSSQQISWDAGSDSSPIEEALAAALDPIDFESGFFQATGGIAFTF